MRPSSRLLASSRRWGDFLCSCYRAYNFPQVYEKKNAENSSSSAAEEEKEEKKEEKKD
jgi:hypothetical protein